VNDPEKPLTEAEKQIRRLEALRMQNEKISKGSAEKAYFPSRTQASKMEDQLRAMRDEAGKPAGARRRTKIEGKQKSSKLTFLQIRVLQQIMEQDKRLRGSVVTRIALNRFLGLDNTADENDFEARINEILRQFKTRT
jgi:hypothetical protein